AAPRAAVAPSLEAPPLDLARLGSLAADDPAFMHELVAAFRGSAARALEEMRGASAASDRERLRRAAHKLKGASDNIGAGRLRDLALRLESCAPSAPHGELGAHVEAIAAELVEVDEFFSAADISALAQRRA
ncbi:MAG: Hpt domain-containing protein, partial [Steroidobacteraceae bacterium]